jgi:hypothetical protein
MPTTVNNQLKLCKDLKTERFAVTFQKSDLQVTVDFSFILWVQLVRQIGFSPFLVKSSALVLCVLIYILLGMLFKMFAL